ncbi:MAG: hypothetical protein ACLP66_23065 [Polyangia bacterium]
MKTTSRQRTPFILACDLASVLIASGCTFDSSQLRALGPDGAAGVTADAGGHGGTGASAGGAGGNGGASVAGAGGGGAGGTGGQVATASGGVPASCVPGASVGCVCATGQQGAQVCTQTGTFGACVCASPTADAGDAGGAGGNGLGGTAGRGDAETVDAPGGQPDVPVGSADSAVDGAGGTCGGGANTTISGVVYDPAGMNPLYNVIVSIPSAALSPFPAGVSCASCASQVSGQPIATAMTDAKGHFVIGNVPWGASFPLVMQLGKWRRQITIPASMVGKQCADNPIADTWTSTTPATLLRLPRNITDGDNNGQYTSMPKIAIAAGNAQSSDLTATERLQCLLRRIGVDASEFTLPSGSGSVRLYNQSKNSDTCNTISGITGTFPDATTSLWDKQADLNQYDVILLNCGGAEEDPTSTSGQAFIPNPAAVNLMEAYVNAGGRVFAEHFHWVWIRSFTGYTSPFGPVATWYNDPGEPNSGTGQIGAVSRDTLIDQSVPKGAAFASWLLNVGATTTPGHLTLSSSVKYTAIDQIKPPSQRWIFEPTPTDAGVPPPDAGVTGAPAQYTHAFSFNTPVGAAESAQCGKFVYTALHVSDSASTGFPGDPSTGSTVFPTCCATRTALSAQEKAMEFMIFDMAACLTPTGGTINAGGATAADGSTTTPTGTTVTFASGKAEGAMTGYGWVDLGAADTITSPTCGTAAITNAAPCQTSTTWNSTTALCITGSIPALSTTAPDYTGNPGVWVGVNSTDSTPSGGLGQSFSSVTITVSGSSGSVLRALVHRKGDPAGTSYCAPLTSGTAMPLTSFSTTCYTPATPGTAITATDVPNIDQISVQVLSLTAAITVSNLCITGITFAM